MLKKIPRVKASPEENRTCLHCCLFSPNCCSFSQLIQLTVWLQLSAHKALECIFALSTGNPRRRMQSRNHSAAKHPRTNLRCRVIFRSHLAPCGAAASVQAFALIPHLKTWLKCLTPVSEECFLLLLEWNIVGAIKKQTNQQTIVTFKSLSKKK